MFRLSVEMFGLPSNITSLRSIEVELQDGAIISDLVGSLRKAIPALTGEVIRNADDLLTEKYTFNINGIFYIGYERLELKTGDRVKLLLIATGG